MNLVITMDFITRCCRREWPEKALRALCLGWMVLFGVPAQADTATDILQYQVERVDDEVLLSAQIAFELPSAVEEALLKGIPMFFVTEAEVLRERWYWSDKKLSVVERHIRLAYQPLMRRWRINVTAGPGRDTSLGLALTQNYESLADALAAVKRVSRWKIADVPDLDGSPKYRVNFSFSLDLSQLPRPFQIGALGQSDWDIAATASSVVSLAPFK